MKKGLSKIKTWGALGVFSVMPALANADYYANLVHVEGEWRITDISNVSDERNIRLGHNVYVGKLKDRACARGFLGTYGGEDCYSEEGTFESGSLDPIGNIAAPIIWLPAALLSLINLAAGNPEEAGTKFLPLRFEYAYDPSFFNKAVKQAYEFDDKARFTKAFQKYEKLKSEAGEFTFHKGASVRDYEQINKSSITSQTYKVTSEARKITGLAKVVNLTGFGASSHTVNGDFHYASPSIPRSSSFAALPKYRYENILSNLDGSVFPAKDISDLENKLSQVKIDIADLVTLNKAKEKRNKESTARYIKDNEARLKAAEQALKTHTYKVGVTSSGQLEGKLRRQNVAFKFDYPTAVVGQPGKMKIEGKKPVLTILSKDFMDLHPQDDLTISNKELKLSLKNGYITVQNKTSNYLTLDALTLYHKSDVLTLGGENFENYREVAPEAEIRLPLSSFNLNSLNNDYYRMTKAKAKKVNVSFGFAGKYRITGRSERKSFYKKKDYRLDQLIAKYQGQAIQL